MDNQIQIPSTRGGKNKRYNFDNFEIGEDRAFKNTNTNKVLVSAKQYCRQHNLEWKFKCYTIIGVSHIVRMK